MCSSSFGIFVKVDWVILSEEEAVEEAKAFGQLRGEQINSRSMGKGFASQNQRFSWVKIYCLSALT